MSYANIIVAVDLGEHARARIRLAGHLADEFHADLVGVAAEMPAYAGAPAGPTPGSSFCAASVREGVLHDLSIARATFEEAAGGRSRVAWRSDLDFPLAFLTAQAAVADLVVCGRGDDGNPLLTVDPGDVVMELGRPVLVVPPKVEHLSAKRAVVAWKNTRESRRAVRDALPLLKRASHVHVATVNESDRTNDARQIASYLHAHGVEATTARTDAPGMSVAEALFEVVSECGADLIVAGAYGHGRLREWAFGGVTRDLLCRAPVCCLISH